MKTSEEKRLAKNTKQLAWHYGNREESLAKQRGYYQKNKEKIKARKRSFYRKNKDVISEAAKKSNRGRRLKVLAHYSCGKLVCNCCGEGQYEFLCIDHIDSNGNTHRREVKTNTIYQWLITNYYPDGFQVLCHNCNMAKGFYGQCPHTTQDKRQVSPTPA